MTHVPVTAAADEDRRVVDKRWKAAVDKKLEEGVVKFKELAEGQQNLLAKLEENTATTTLINKKLDEHVGLYNEFTNKVQPAVDAISTMQAGVRVLGKIGAAVAWVGNNVRRAVIWLTPVVAAVAAVWHYFTGGSGKP